MKGTWRGFSGVFNRAGRIDKAIGVAMRYGMIEGDHHKQWVIDRMVRHLLGSNGYALFLTKMCGDTDQEPWNTGTPP
jgi:hypothetical protein|tara:strand:- start:7321 stop:7551 length:231 start_codon:yes stop_codon:yes gene_type:complete